MTALLRRENEALREENERLRRTVEEYHELLASMPRIVAETSEAA